MIINRCAPLPTGVTQGSILGPLVFAFYTFLFISQLLRSFTPENLNDAVQKVNYDYLGSIHNWTHLRLCATVMGCNNVTVPILREKRNPTLRS